MDKDSGCLIYVAFFIGLILLMLFIIMMDNLTRGIPMWVIIPVGLIIIGIIIKKTEKKSPGE